MQILASVLNHKNPWSQTHHLFWNAAAFVNDMLSASALTVIGDQEQVTCLPLIMGFKCIAEKCRFSGWANAVSAMRATGDATARARV